MARHCAHADATPPDCIRTGDRSAGSALHTSPTGLCDSAEAPSPRPPSARRPARRSSDRRQPRRRPGCRRTQPRAHRGALQADLLTQDLRASPRDHAAADDQRLGRREASALGDAPCPGGGPSRSRNSILHGVPHGGLKRAPRRIDTVCPVGPRVASTANSRQSGIVFRLLARPTPS